MNEPSDWEDTGSDYTTKHHENTINNTIQYRGNNTNNTIITRKSKKAKIFFADFFFHSLFEKMVFMVFSRRRPMVFSWCGVGVYGVTLAN
ncbi:MAG: hypothetical protein WCX22_01915 [Methanoregula sp.]